MMATNGPGRPRLLIGSIIFLLTGVGFAVLAVSQFTAQNVWLGGVCSFCCVAAFVMVALTLRRAKKSG
ncbi:putative membrane protein YhhN [Mycetocola sp. 2940]